MWSRPLSLRYFRGRRNLRLLPEPPSISHLAIKITDSLAEHDPDESINNLRGAHSRDISSQLGDLLFEALGLRGLTLAPLAALRISTCMGGNRFRSMVGEMGVKECGCPSDHLEWFESDQESDGDSD